MLPPPVKVEVVNDLMVRIYGSTDSFSFPLPLDEKVAGNSVGSPNQRRYLWTDAWGILNFCSQALVVEREDEKQMYLSSAKKLLDAVLLTLGTSSSESFPMRRIDESRNAGLRIGKVKSRTPSDYGMQFDGMYFHYFDKILFAMMRYATISKDKEMLDKAIDLVKVCHPAFFVKNQGIRWKINVDMTPIPDASPTRPSSDAVSAYCIYRLLNHYSTTAAAGDDEKNAPLTAEIEELKPVVVAYFSSPVSQLLQESFDPLGLGTHLFVLQFLEGDQTVVGTNFNEYRQRLLEMARHILEPTLQEAFSRKKSSQLDFRIYGGLLGLKCTSTSSLIDLADSAVQAFISRDELSRHDDNRAINLVMLAAAVNCAAFTCTVEDCQT